MASLTHFNPETPSFTMKLKQTTIDLVGGISCHICQRTLANKRDFDTHYVQHNTGSKEIVYTCVVCHKQIAGYPSFRGHCYTTHVIRERHKCQYCLKSFSKSSSLNEHVKIMHKIKCITCNKEFTTKKEYHLHKVIHDNHHDTPPFDCKSCQTKLESVAKCKEHIYKHASDIYTCPICSENIPNKGKAIDHLKIHFVDANSTNSEGQSDVKEEITIEKSREAAISCLFCSTVYKNRVEFDAHFSWRHGEEDIVYRCVECGEPFEKYSKFSSHMYDHYAKDRYQCDLCSKAFCRLSKLVSHMLACQEDAEATGMPFICTQCDCRYSSAMSLRRHMRVTHHILQLVCPEQGCKLTFSKSDQLMFHQKTHHQSSKNWCGQCGLYFTSLNSCERHLDIHKKKLYICPVCNRHYSDSRLIMSHMSQHFEAVLHICKVCGKVFNAKNRLVEHTKSHSETKCHKCQYCKKSFMKIAQLQQHLNVHTGSKPFKCPVCDKSFTSYPNWSKHIRRMHNIDGEKSKNILKKSDVDVLVDNQKDVINVKNEIENVLNGKTDNIPSADDTAKISNDNIDDCYIFYESGENTIESNSTDCTINEDGVESFENTNDTGSESYKSPGEKLFTSYTMWSKHSGEHNIDNRNYGNVLDSSNIEVFKNDNNQREDINKNFKNGIKNIVNEKANGVTAHTNATSKVSNENVDSYIFYELEENSIESNSIDHTVIEKEMETFEVVINDKISNNIGNVLPVNRNNILVDGTQATLSNLPQSMQTVDFPPEYGPEFNTGLESNWGSSFIDLDDHNLPHINPLLTIKIEEHNKVYMDTQSYYEPSPYNHFGNTPKWEPPIITKVHHDYTYSYGDIAEANRLTVLNGDNFEVFT